MSSGMLTDGKGEVWTDRSGELARRLGYCHPTLDLAAYAVEKRGFIHLRERDKGVRVALRAGKVKLATVLGGILILSQMRPRRILLTTLAQGLWSHEILSDHHEFGQRAEQLAADGPIEQRHPWLAVDRSIGALASPLFAPMRPLVGLWEAERGRLPDDLDDHLAALGLLHRVILVRRQGSSRLVFVQFGSSLEIVPAKDRPDMVGRGFDDLPDRAYGAWIGQAYAANVRDRRPRLESIQAKFRQSETIALRGRYDRLMLPWQGKGGEPFVMSVALTRACL
jgi:hypothetical protein